MRLNKNITHLYAIECNGSGEGVPAFPKELNSLNPGKKSASCTGLKGAAGNSAVPSIDKNLASESRLELGTQRAGLIVAAPSGASLQRFSRRAVAGHSGFRGRQLSSRTSDQLITGRAARKGACTPLGQPFFKIKHRSNELRCETAWRGEMNHPPKELNKLRYEN